MSVSNIRAFIPARRRSGAFAHERDVEVERASVSLAREFLRAAAGKERGVVLAAIGTFLGQIDLVAGSSDRSETFKLIEAAMDAQVQRKAP